jgi:hypothetical protein
MSKQTKSSKKAKTITEKEAQRIAILSRDSGTLSKSAVSKQAELKKQKPAKTEDTYLETVILSGDPFSVGELAKEMDMSFQSVRAKVLRIAKHLNKKISIESRGKWTAK